ncbi:MAG: HAMP domain-containing histidine kinase [Clostridiales bacterium]|nr:HAMP domain-containing histidine kinase [Clostridiales bacterium]
MKALLKAIRNKLFGEGVPLEVQTFHLLGIAGMAAGILVALSCLVTKAGIFSIIVNLAASFLAYCLLLYSRKPGRYLLCYRIVVIAVFLIAFPVLFFSAGGYRSGMSSFFAFALVFTAIMLQGRDRAIALAAEFAIYISCCLIAYVKPETVSNFDSEWSFVLDVITGIIVANALLLSVIVLYVRIYRRDQIKLKEQSELLDVQNARLRQLDRIKTEFLTNVAHEIKTPLAVIMGGASETLDLLKDDPQDALSIVRDQRVIMDSAKNLNAVVLDLLDTTAIESGRLSLKPALIDLAGFLRETVSLLFESLDQNGNTLHFELTLGLPPVQADPGRLKQVLGNIMSNALRHTIKGEITVRLTGEDGFQAVSITDNGEGMAREVSSQALNGYMDSNAHYWRGGIGLYICSQIVAAHGGKISVSSEPGKGSSVVFALPEKVS